MVPAKKPDYEELIYETLRKDIVRITFNRPEKRNALPIRGGRWNELHDALKKAADNDDVKVVILRGAGPCFCGGYDLGNLDKSLYDWKGDFENRPSVREIIKKDLEMYWSPYLPILYFPKILIAQLHGACIGGGMFIANLCDMKIASDDCKIGHVDQRIGFGGSAAPDIFAFILSVGLTRARGMMLRGNVVSGKEAEQIGLVNMSVPVEKLEDTVMKVAKEICLLPKDGITLGKAMNWLVYEQLGVTSGLMHGVLSHAFYINARYEPDEFNYIKESAEKGGKGYFKERDRRYRAIWEE